MIQNKKLFVFSLFFSLFVHVACLFVLQFSNGNSLNRSEELTKMEEMVYLQTVFSKVYKQKHTLEQQQRLPKKFDEKNYLTTLSVTSIENDRTSEKRIESLLKDHKLMHDRVLSKVDLKTQPTFDRKLRKKALFTKADFSLTPNKRQYSAVNAKTLKVKKAEDFTASCSKPISKNALKAIAKKPPIHFELTKEFSKPIKQKNSKTTVHFSEKKFGFFRSKDLKIRSCAEEFDIDVSYLPRDKGKGYIFALTLIPKPFAKFPKVKQNIFFLLDRSNGIGKKRFHITQSAVLRALSYLSEEDTFNILTFDNHVELFSPHNLNKSKDSIARAKRFLDDLSLGNIFTSSAITAPLYSLLSYPCNEEDVNIAILLTNGEGISQAFNNKKLMDSWTQSNQGKISLYSLLLDTDEEGFAMKMFASFNRGKTFSSSSTRGIKRKLLKLMNSISHPIAKDVSISTIAKNSQTNIQLQRQLLSPHIYDKEPYVILGYVDELEDFTLFVQAKQNGKNIHIKKQISFKDASIAPKSIQKEWALQKAFEQYKYFTKYNDPRFLQMMRKYLEPYEISADVQ